MRGSCPPQKPSNESFSSHLPKPLCHMWKLEAPKELERGHSHHKMCFSFNHICNWRTQPPVVIVPSLWGEYMADVHPANPHRNMLFLHRYRMFATEIQSPTNVHYKQTLFLLSGWCIPKMVKLWFASACLLRSWEGTQLLPSTAPLVISRRRRMNEVTAWPLGSSFTLGHPWILPPSLLINHNTNPSTTHQLTVAACPEIPWALCCLPPEWAAVWSMSLFPGVVLIRASPPNRHLRCGLSHLTALLGEGRWGGRWCCSRGLFIFRLPSSLQLMWTLTLSSFRAPGACLNIEDLGNARQSCLQLPCSFGGGSHSIHLILSSIWFAPSTTLEAPITHHLRDLAPNLEKCKAVHFCPP